MLKWVRQRKCPWSYDTTGFAAQGGHAHVFAWAVQNGCDMCEWKCLTVAENDKYEHLPKWIRKY
jgi:hypothetical protein